VGTLQISTNADGLRDVVTPNRPSRYRHTKTLRVINMMVVVDSWLHLVTSTVVGDDYRLFAHVCTSQVRSTKLNRDQLCGLQLTTVAVPWRNFSKSKMSHVSHTTPLCKCVTCRLNFGMLVHLDLSQSTSKVKVAAMV